MSVEKIVWCDNPHCDNCEILETGEAASVLKSKGWIFKAEKGKMQHFCDVHCAT